MPKDPGGIKSLAVQTFHHSELSDEIFQLLWAGGETMVVTDLLPKMHIKWTPEYFIKHYGNNDCAITDCDTETVQRSTVREFFGQFGKYSHRGGSILKLKDWPPTADFKNAFPALFDDFHRAVPAPNYTRRDGFYNFSAHFPTNAVVPDMGPKMYNAFRSREDGYGSTRLHMDMVCLSYGLRQGTT
jgi:[histone H3]-dimethyl-L-lysine9 demethylase